jgi:hypothetical protein
MGKAREKKLGRHSQGPRLVSSSFPSPRLHVSDSQVHGRCEATVPPPLEQQFTKRHLYSLVDIYDALVQRDIGLASVLQDPIFTIGGPAALGSCSAANVLDELERVAQSWNLSKMTEVVRSTRTLMEGWREEEKRKMESEGLELLVDPLEGIPKLEPVRRQVNLHPT